jgi:hypothetical protein
VTPRRSRRDRAIAAAAGLLWIVAGTALAPPPAAGLVVATDPDDGSTFLHLFRPTGQFDETGLSGFEFLISSRTEEFRENDQYLIAGEATLPETSLGRDFGTVANLSGTPFAFSIRHNLSGGRHFAFQLTDLSSNDTSVLCWGQNCPAGSIASERLNGLAPIRDYNGLQIQARAQDVPGSSTTVAITSLLGLDVVGEDFFAETVTPDVAGTIFPFDVGRRGQWLLGDELDFVLHEWELTGTVMLSRPDDALVDVTKVRLAVDFVRDPRLPYLLPVPEASGVALLGAGLLALGGRARRRGGRERRELRERRERLSG